MYRIYCNGNILHHPMTRNVAESAILVEELNTQGSLDIVLGPDADTVKILSPVTVFDDDGLVWRGRILSIDGGANLTRNVHCEGALGLLNDCVVPPFGFRGNPSDLFTAFMGYASDVGLTKGTMSVTDPNNYVYRANSEPMSVWDALMEKLVNTPLGGYITLTGADLTVVNYVSDFLKNGNPDTCGQVVRFGKNIIEFAQSMTADGLITAMHGYGAQYDESSQSHEDEPIPAGQTGFGTWNGNRLHGYATNSSAVAKFGTIVGFNTWDDITQSANLANAMNRYLTDNINAHVASVEVKAADLSLIDGSIEKIKVGKYVRCIYEPTDFDELLLCIRKDTDLIDVKNTQITLGRRAATLSGMVGG